jgi:uncharacterized membrane protein
MKNNLTDFVSDFIKRNYFNWLVILVIIFSFLLRFLRTKVGLPYLYNWDEPQIASTALKIMKTGDYNPHFFHYGSLMIYINLIVDILHYFYLMGQPLNAEAYLTSLNDIKINMHLNGWLWGISHPSFYHWNRILTALIGTGMVFVTYKIGRYIFNRWVGLVAAFFLATIPYVIAQSAWATVDTPVSFFVVLVVLFSILFIRNGKIVYFILSLVFTGMAIATKYNSAIVILAPAIALPFHSYTSKESIKPYMWFLLPLIPFCVFLFIMPYAILDLTTFLKHVGFEIRHYKVLGQRGVTSSPGLDHFIFQMHQFYKHLSLTNTIIIGIGLIGILFRPLLIYVLIVPFTYIIYMTGMKPNFHRNFVQVYPFIALLFGSGLFYLYNFLVFLQRRSFTQKQWISSFFTVCLTSYLLIPQASSSLKESLKVYNSKDTRTKLVEYLNNFKNYNKLIIAKELRIHPQDLRKIKTQYKILPLLTIADLPKTKQTLYVLPPNSEIEIFGLLSMIKT